MEILTGLLVVITGLYAFFTFKILKANEGVLNEMRRQQDSLYRPYISIFPVLYPDDPVFYLKIKNTGHTAAHNVQLSLDRDFYQFGENKEERNLRNSMAFSNKIDSFVPGSEICFYLAQSFKIFNEKADETITPSAFTITAEYEYSNQKVQEESSIDLRPYLNSAIPKDPIVVKLKEIKEAIEKGS